MKSSEVDVIIPVFNGERFLAEALRSVQQQTFPVAQIIIADDGSTDGTRQVAAGFMANDERITYLKLPHAGVSAARNAGIAASSAPFIAFLDADDIWLPEKLELQIQAFEQGGPEIGFVHSSYFYINQHGESIPDMLIFEPKQRGDIFMPLLLEGYVLSGSASSVMVRREVLDKAGHFDERLFHGEDWDLWIRLARISKVDFTPEAVVGIRVHDQSAQRRPQADREIQFFNQQLLVYAKWEELIEHDHRLKESLRNRACNLALPLLRRPWRAQHFYRQMAASESRLARSIFSGPAHFWSNIFLRVLRYIWWRTKRWVGMNDQ
ncbi:glycosyltransferase [Azovibrio restrictus]|uniref:glycosyltransferase family 2 protein n=1 Tax=Azovibrio restrictus TaxID=146938 RepID=UPI0026F0BADC|nr:glycosyltransferase [Azovibrio restrictus]